LHQQDTVRPHTIAAITDAIARLRFTVLPHPACSPVLASSNFHLFPNLKEDPRDQNLSSDAETKAAICQWLQKKENYSWTEFKNLLNAGKRILKLEDIMWSSDYGEL